MGYDGASLGNWLPTFRRNLLVSRFEMSNKSWTFRKLKMSPLHCLEISGTQYRVKPHYIAKERNFSYTAAYLLTYLFTPWSRILEKLTGSQLVKKLPAFYGTRMFIIVFTSSRHLFLS